jgi:repressor LexA
MIVDRVLRIIELKGLNKSQFYKETGLSNGFLDKVRDIGASKIEDILNAFPEINPTWLLTGKGDMILDQFKGYAKIEQVTKGARMMEEVTAGARKMEEVTTGADKLLAERVSDFSLQLSKEGTFPIVSVESIAGFGSANFSIEKKHIEDYCTIPIWKDRKIDFVVPVRGQSMLPKYKSGDLVACKIITEGTFIQWNEIHVIATREQGILLKRLKKSTIEKHITAISDNPEYDPFDIPEDEITGIALVIGGVSLE